MRIETAVVQCTSLRAAVSGMMPTTLLRSRWRLQSSRNESGRVDRASCSLPSSTLRLSALRLLSNRCWDCILLELVSSSDRLHGTLSISLADIFKTGPHHNIVVVLFRQCIIYIPLTVVTQNMQFFAVILIGCFI